MFRKIMILILSLSSCQKEAAVLVEKKVEIVYIEKIKYIDKVRYIDKERYIDEFSIPTDFVSPMKKYIVSSKFGFRKNPMGGIVDFDMHKGVDLVGPKNSEVYAVKDGIVAISYPPPNGHFKGHPIYGGMLLIDHGDGVFTLYGHFKTTYVREKMIVKKGQLIGVQGNTGLSTGPHLHFEILVDPVLALEE